MPREIHNWLKKKTENLNRLVSKEIGVVNKNFAIKRSQGPCGFANKSDWIFKEEIIPVFSIHFQKIQEETRANSFFETSVTLTPKATKLTREKKTANIPYGHEYKTSAKS